MSRRVKLIVLMALLAVLAVLLYFNLRGSPELAQVLAGSQRLPPPLDIPNPTLRLDLLAKISKLDYSGTRRDIFSPALPPPPTPPANPPPRTEISQPSGREPLVVPFRYFGYVENARTGRRRATFTNGEDIWIAAEGEMLLGRYRVLRIGNDSAVVEEVSTGRRATLVIEPLPPS